MSQELCSVFSKFFKPIGLLISLLLINGALSIGMAATSIPQGIDASWTAAASTGVADDEVPNTRYSYDDGFVELPSSVPFDPSNPRNNTLWIRYNVAVPEGFFVKEVIEIDDSNILNVLDDPEQFGGFKLIVRFRDNGAAEKIVVKLMELNGTTGQLEELIRFDSDDFEAAQAQSDGFKRATADCIFEVNKPGTAASFNKTLAALNFDFKFNPSSAYFIRAELTRNNATGSPALSVIQITRDLASCG